MTNPTPHYPQPCLLALDGGGTKTLCAVVARDGSLRALRKESGINPFDGPQWRGVLTQCLRDLPPGVVGGGFGLAGYGEDRALSGEVRALALALLDGPIAFGNDVEFACAGAFADAPGTLLLAGTGSMAWRNEGAGHTRRAGGFGALFGDEGSAYWIGRAALGALSQALDGRRALPARDVAGLLGLVGVAGDCADPQAGLLAWYAGLTAPRREVAALAAGVDRLATDGNMCAQGLLDEAADCLGAHLAALHDGTETVRWSHGGSVFHSARVLARLTARFGAPMAPRLPPVGGSALRAARMLGWTIDDGWIARLAAALAAAGDAPPG